MRNQFGACAAQTHQPAALGIAHQLQRLLLEIKPLAGLKLPGQQAVERAIHTQGIRQQALRQRMALALIILRFINDQPGGCVQQIQNFQRQFCHGDFVAGFQHQTRQRRLLARITSGFLHGSKIYADGSEIYVRHLAQTQIRFTIAQPALAHYKFSLLTHIYS